jgi:thioredoxin-related protein
VWVLFSFLGVLFFFFFFFCFRPPTFKKHIFKEVDECNGTITNFHKVLLILVIFGIKECYFSDCTKKKQKKQQKTNKKTLLKLPIT